jgi:hypothetical protein
MYSPSSNETSDNHNHYTQPYNQGPSSHYLHTSAPYYTQKDYSK